MDEQRKNKKVAFILGAGFSKCADLPVQADLTPLLTSEEFNSPLDKVITQIIVDFLAYAFGWQKDTEIPSLEDVFTSIDISARNGTNLGNAYQPEKLRALRRILIYRTFQILDQRFSVCDDIVTLLRHYQDYDCSFVSMNWDIVLEKHLAEIDPNTTVNYITPSYNWQQGIRARPSEGIKICKMHGSSNWAYCKNCKTLFYQLDQKLSLHKKVGLFPEDFKLFDACFDEAIFESCSSQINEQDDKCLVCNSSLTTHIATFSYRKSFRTAAYSAIWHEAENQLAEADKWVFIGYSLPEADFELKHLIKSAEIRLKHKEPLKQIDVVLYQDKFAIRKFKRFFGPEQVRIFENGLTEYVQQL